MSKTEQLTAALRAAFAPRELEVVDDSESHRGHGGWREGGETHFNLRIRAEAFKGMSRVARHRAIHAAIGPELMARIHALAIDVDS
jgi:BolA family transcriptional regulator, general stress-responsive regulator